MNGKKVSQLRGHLQQLGVDTHGLKAELVSRLRSAIDVGVNVEVPDDTLKQVKLAVLNELLLISNGKDGNSSNAEEKKERLCWGKGNWVTCATNIAGQVDFLGCLPLIW